MKKALVVMGGLLLYPYPSLAGLVFLLAFWEDFGNLTLAVLDDRSLERTRKALNTSVEQTREALRDSLHADVNIFHAYALAMRLKEERSKKPFREKLKAVGRWMMACLNGLKKKLPARRFNVESYGAHFDSERRTGLFRVRRSHNGITAA